MSKNRDLADLINSPNFDDITLGDDLTLGDNVSIGDNAIIGDGATVTGTLTTDKMIVTSADDNNPESGAIWLYGQNNALVFDRDGDGRAIKRITCNDGGGNFNIRSGNYYTAATNDTYMGPGGAVIMTMRTDANDGQIEILVAPQGDADTSIPTATIPKIMLESVPAVFSISNTDNVEIKDGDLDVDVGNITATAGNITATAGDFEAVSNSSGIILKSPDGTRWRVQVDNDGALTTTEIV
jgi:hypothetical protein